jgi:hypothetical protein
MSHAASDASITLLLEVLRVLAVVGGCEGGC